MMICHFLPLFCRIISKKQNQKSFVNKAIVLCFWPIFATLPLFYSFLENNKKNENGSILYRTRAHAHAGEVLSTSTGKLAKIYLFNYKIIKNQYIATLKTGNILITKWQKWQKIVNSGPFLISKASFWQKGEGIYHG